MPLRLHIARPGERLGEAGQVLGLPPDTVAGVNVVAFLIEGGVLRPEELPGIDEEARHLYNQLDPARPVLISGRGPLWLYALLVHNLHMAPVLATWDPRQRLGVVVQAPDDSMLGTGVGVDGVLRSIEMPGVSRNPGDLAVKHGPVDDKYIFHVEPRKRFIHPAVLPAVMQRLPEHLATDKLVVIEGHMSTWLAAALAARYCHGGKAFGVYDPRLRGAVVAASHSPEYRVGDVVAVTEEEIDRIAGLRETRVIGVLGDPNSGKSVFLHLLNNALRDRGLTTMVQEGNIYTPEAGQSPEQHMDPKERLRQIISSLGRAKKNQAADYVLVNLGGGRPDLGQRITRENQAILRYVDYTIIVSRNDSGNIDAWLDEMIAYTPDVRVAAVLESRLHGEPRLYRTDPIPIGVATGLDRDLHRQQRIPPLTLEIARTVAESITAGKAVPPSEAKNLWDKATSKQQQQT